LKQKPSVHGFESNLWRNRDIQLLIERQFGVRHSNGYVRELVDKLGMSHRMRPATPRTEKKRCTMNAEARSWIAAVLKHSPQIQGLEGECWTNAKLREVIYQRFGVRYSRGYVWEIATGLGLSDLIVRRVRADVQG
jgi:transposase